MRKLWRGLAACALAGAAAAGCSSEPAIAPLDEGDVVESGAGSAEASNLDRFEAFLAVTESGGEDAVRIVNYTIEGDPIYTDISFSEGKYVVFVDRSEDAFAAEEARERKQAAECEKLTKTDRPDGYGEYACGTYKFMVENLE